MASQLAIWSCASCAVTWLWQMHPYGTSIGNVEWHSLCSDMTDVEGSLWHLNWQCEVMATVQ